MSIKVALSSLPWIKSIRKEREMSRLLTFFEEKFVPIAAKIGGQKHLLAIRDAFAGLMPLIMAGAIAVLLNNVFSSHGHF